MIQLFSEAVHTLDYRHLDVHYIPMGKAYFVIIVRMNNDTNKDWLLVKNHLKPQPMACVNTVARTASRGYNSSATETNDIN